MYQDEYQRMLQERMAPKKGVVEVTDIEGQPRLMVRFDQAVINEVLDRKLEGVLVEQSAAEKLGLKVGDHVQVDISADDIGRTGNFEVSTLTPLVQ